MGMARLLAKAWIMFCVFAGAHALRLAWLAGGDPFGATLEILVCVVLFGAMGSLFVGGFGLPGSQSAGAMLRDFKPAHLVPSFNDMVFAGFVWLSFADQVVFAPAHLSGWAITWLERAVYFAVPAQHVFGDQLSICALDGGRLFASAFTWWLAVIFLGSALSRIKLMAGIMRLEQARRPQTLSPMLLAGVLGVAAVVAIQMLFVGSLYPWLPCSLMIGIPGALLTGLAPLYLVYTVLAAVTAFMAASTDK